MIMQEQQKELRSAQKESTAESRVLKDQVSNLQQHNLQLEEKLKLMTPKLMESIQKPQFEQYKRPADKRIYLWTSSEKVRNLTGDSPSGHLYGHRGI